MLAFPGMQPTPGNPYGLHRPPFPPSQPPPAPEPTTPPAPEPPPRSAAAAAGEARLPAALTTRRARAAGLALLACCAAMAAGVASFHWFGFDHAALGLGGMKECFGASCRTLMWSELARVPGDYALFGDLSVLALAGAIALALHAAIVLLAGTPRVRTSALEVALGLAGFATVAFWLRVAAGFGADLAYGYAGFLAIAGVAAAAVVVHGLGRERAPAAAPPRQYVM